MAGDKTQLRIGLVSPYFVHRHGGVMTLLRALKVQLEANGHIVKLIAPRPRDKAAQKQVPPDTILIGRSAEINFKAPFHTTHPVAATFGDELDEMLEAEQFDIINVHEPWMPMLPNQIVARANCPVVGTLHARWPRSFVNKTIEKARTPYVRSTIKKLDAITAVSTEAAKNAFEAYKHADVAIIPNAIDLDSVKKMLVKSKPQKRPIILFLNRLEKRKGPMHLLRAYRQLVERGVDCQLVIAGSGPLEDQLRDYVMRYSLPNVKFEGYVSEAKKYKLLSKASVYTSPAPYGESFGIVLIEAMAAGTPIVAGDNDGYRTVLTGTGKMGLVTPKDSQQYADRLELMMFDQRSRQAFLDWEKAEIGQYDFEVIAWQYLEVYLRTLGRL